MSECNQRIRDFLQATCAQIRFKSVHKSIINELSDHIEEQKLEYIKQGLDEETAINNAVEQMGDPILIGKQLDKAHQPKTEWSVLLLAAILVVIGGLVQFFFSTVNTYNSNEFTYFLTYASIGVVALVITYFFDYTLIGRYSKLVYIMLIAVTLAGFPILNKSNGAYTHVYYAVLLFIPAYAAVIYGFRDRGYLGILACGLFYVPAAFVCIIAPRLTGLILLSIAYLIILTVAIIKSFFKCNKKASLAIIYISTAIIGIIPVLSIFSAPYRRSRFWVMLNPELDPQGFGWLQLVIRKLIAGSRPFGKAVIDGNLSNTPIERLLPCWATDFSLTYIIAQFGYVAGIAIIITIFLLIIRMFQSVVKQKNRLGLLLSFAATISISGQFILYTLSNIGVITPLSSTLPFISFGGIGYVTNMILIGLVLSVHRRTNITIDNQQGNIKDKPIFTFENGKLIIDFGIKSPKRTE